MRRTILLLISIVVLAIAMLLILFWPQQCDAPVTCETAAQCGGDIEQSRFCREGNVFANGQRNTCERAGRCDASCITNYDPWLVETCEGGCADGRCLS